MNAFEARGFCFHSFWKQAVAGTGRVLTCSSIPLPCFSLLSVQYVRSVLAAGELALRRPVGRSARCDSAVTLRYRAAKKNLKNLAK